MFKDQYGPWCVVAGGSEGIGAAFAREAANRGLKLLLLARKPGPLRELADEIRAAHAGSEVHTLSLDLAAPDASRQIKAATSELEVGLFIYNAGAEPVAGYFLDHEWEHHQARLQRNVMVKTELVHHFGRLMRARRHGGIILMGSIAGYMGSPGVALYGASKSYASFLTEGLWYELKTENVHLLCPVVGLTRTPAMEMAYGKLSEDAADPAFVAKNSLDQLAHGPIWVADDIVKTVNILNNMAPGDRAEMSAQMSESLRARGTLGV